MNNQRAFPAYGQILQLQFIVTAAVHQGFSSEREPASLTVWHWAGVSSHTLSCDFAETYVFDKQLLGPLYCDLSLKRYPFSRSYGVILPSSLERVISRPLVYSTYPPVSVMVQAFFIYDSASFSWKYDIDYFNALAFRIHILNSKRFLRFSTS